MKVVVPVASLCPCSKSISDYGAHNQRSHMSISVRTNSFVWIEDIVKIAEDKALAESNVQSAIGEKTVRKVIFVPGRILNVVVG